MDNELLESTKKEAKTVLDQMDICTDKTSDKYGILLQTYRDLMKIQDEEQERINSVRELDYNERKTQLEIEIEEKKLKEQRRSDWRDIAKKATFAGLIFLGNVGVIFASIWANNSGETLNSFQNKFINPGKFK